MFKKLRHKYVAIWQKEKELPWYLTVASSALEFAIWLGILFLIKTFIFQPFRVFGQSMDDTLHNGDLLIISKISYNETIGGDIARGDVVVLRPPVEYKSTETVNLGSSGQEVIYLDKQSTSRSNIEVNIKPKGQYQESDFKVEILSKKSDNPLLSLSRELINLAFYDRVRITGPAHSSLILEITEIPDYYIKRIIGLPGDQVKISNGQVYINGKRLEENYLSSGDTNVPGQRNANYTVPADSYFVLGDNRNNSIDSRSCFKNSCKKEDGTPFVPRQNIIGKATFVFWPRTSIGKEMYPEQ